MVTLYFQGASQCDCFPHLRFDCLEESPPLKYPLFLRKYRMRTVSAVTANCSLSDSSVSFVVKWNRDENSSLSRFSADILPFSEPLSLCLKRADKAQMLFLGCVTRPTRPEASHAT